MVASPTKEMLNAIKLGYGGEALEVLRGYRFTKGHIFCKSRGRLGAAAGGVELDLLSLGLI